MYTLNSGIHIKKGKLAVNNCLPNLDLMWTYIAWSITQIHNVYTNGPDLETNFKSLGLKRMFNLNTLISDFYQLSILQIQVYSFAITIMYWTDKQKMLVLKYIKYYYLLIIKWLWYIQCLWYLFISYDDICMFISYDDICMFISYDDICMFISYDDICMFISYDLLWWLLT